MSDLIAIGWATKKYLWRDGEVAGWYWSTCAPQPFDSDMYGRIAPGDDVGGVD
jgi:hypothetical protein